MKPMDVLKDTVGVSVARAAALVLAITSTVTPASAALVSQWDFEVHSGFTAFSPAGVTGSNDNAFLTGLPPGGIPALGGGTVGPFASAPTLLSWGDPATPAGQSGLSAGSPTGTATGSLDTNGPAVDTLVMTHFNNPVFTPFLETATLTGLGIMARRRRAL